MKRALAWMGVDAGYCRRPFINITNEEEEAHKKVFRKIKEQYSITGVDFLDAL